MCFCACSWGYVHVGTRLQLDSIHNTLLQEKKRTDPFAAHNLEVSTFNPMRFDVTYLTAAEGPLLCNDHHLRGGWSCGESMAARYGDRNC